MGKEENKKRNKKEKKAGDSFFLFIGQSR